MPVDPQSILNSQYGVGLASAFGRIVPPRAGLQLARYLARWIASHRKWQMVRAVRANQWVVSGGTLCGEALDKAVQENFYSTAHFIYDLYHHTHNQELMRQKLVLSPELEWRIQQPRFGYNGVVIVGVHLSGFDFALQSGYLRDRDILVLTLPELTAGYQMQFEMRRRTGMNFLPASISALRQALEHLANGGMVMTGIDRPAAGARYRPRFFDRPAALPLHHITIALKACVPILLIATTYESDGKYHLEISDPIEMQPHPDRQTEMIANGERVLKVAETYIRQAPEHWAMTFPVWPEVLEQVH